MGFKETIVENSPTILTIGGIVAIGVGTIFACRATLKAQKVIEEHKKDREDLEADAEAGVDDAPEKDSKEYKSEVAKIYGHTALNLGKTYILPAVLITGGVIAILGGHKILNDRYVKTSAALTATTAAYNQLNDFIKKYRKAVVDDQGADKDKQYAYGFSGDKVDTVDENGKKVKLGKDDAHMPDGVSDKDISDLEKINPYAYVFDSRSTEWKKNPAMNMTTLIARQNYWNDVYNQRFRMSKADGKVHLVYLSEVLESLGYSRQYWKPGTQLMCWNPVSSNGDGYIDFGISEFKYPQNESFACGFVSSCVLDFNCDGIYSEGAGEKTILMDNMPISDEQYREINQK